MIAIIVPAHNESAVLSRCLTAILAQADPTEFEVIVVCNGCTDNSASIARAFGPRVLVKELPEASKVSALNAGDSIARGFPRLYVDADVELSTAAVRELANALAKPEPCIGSPRPQFLLAGASWPVRAFYAVWAATDYFQTGIIGTGVYALNEAGRRRFDVFPKVIADDGFVRSLFSASERIRIDSNSVLIHPPRNLTDLLKVRTRSRLGIYQLRRHFPMHMKNEFASRNYAKTALRMLGKPRLWPALSVYLLVQVVSRLRAYRQSASLASYSWERDDSSRR